MIPRRLSPRAIGATLAASALALALCGCVSVLPKSKPDQLYSFGQSPGAAAPAARTPGQAQGVLLAMVAFPRAATGDGILTITGARNAYIGQSRWIGPASVLFREGVERAFDRQSTGTRLLARGETGRNVAVLRIDVQDFEAVYGAGQDSPPTVVVGFRARLSRPDGTALDEKSFEARLPAGDNRVGPIVAAFDAAANQTLKGLVDWADQTVASVPPTETSAAVTTTTSRSVTSTRR